jgi:RES domain-containing protein
VILWRISSYADLSGTGGLRVSGRWHQAGRPVVYAAASPPGAMLEVLVHLEIDPEDFPTTLQLLRIEVPDSATQAPMPALPAGWSTTPGLTRGIGNQFLDECNALLLPVASAIIPSTVNYLFNPRHPEAQTATVQVEQFTPDSRLF